MKTYDRLLLASQHPELTQRVEKALGHRFHLIMSLGKKLDDIIKPEIADIIKMEIPQCVIINGITFLVGEKHPFADTITDNDFDIYEMFDMTTEINEGHSHSIYSTVNSYFIPASAEETLKVIKYFERTLGGG